MSSVQANEAVITGMVQTMNGIPQPPSFPLAASMLTRERLKRILVSQEGFDTLSRPIRSTLMQHDLFSGMALHMTKMYTLPTAREQGRHSPIFLQFFYQFSIFFLNRF
jgi:hypothetical protein